MTAVIPDLGVVAQAASRRAVARRRAAQAWAALEDCRLCAHDCRANRLAGERGPCQAGTSARVFSAQTEVSDELELIPVFAIALSGCDLRCDFCITGRESWDVRAGVDLNVAEIGCRARMALEQGARTVMVLGGEPTIHIPTALEIVSELPDNARLIWKTNAHGSVEARQLLDGLFDIWVADYKFGNDGCARRLARVEGYRRGVEDNLTWASEHSDLIVRHLLMPAHVDCCWKAVAEWLAEQLPGVKVNLRAGFWPAWQAARHPEFHHTVSSAEAARAWAIARDLNLRLIQ